MKIFFHGASVTQQSGASSYFQVLQNRVNKIEGIILRRSGYGGCHLNDAGFLTINSDTNEVTDVCVLEWNTTGLSIFDEQKLQYMAGVLLSKDILPVFLILARRDTIQNSRDSERQVIKFCTDNNLLCLDYRDTVGIECGLRDDVHTNEIGANMYADRLFYDLIDNKLNISNVGLYFNYKEFNIYSLRNIVLDVIEGFSVVIELANVQDGAQVIIETIRGPSSPIINIDSKRICIWDQWCHFERPGFIIIASNLLNLNSTKKSLFLHVLHDNIDYSICSRTFSYNGVKELKIRGIHGIDCDPVLISIT